MKQEIRDYFAKFGKEGGKTRAKNMTAEQRHQAARKAVEARWAKQKELAKQITKGTKQLLKTSKANAASVAQRRSR